MKKILFFVCASIALNASAQTEVGAESVENKEKLEKQVAQAVTSPLSDLNIGNDDIPKILVNAKTQLYNLPENTTCSNLESEIDNLDAVLGLDLDEKENEGKPGFVKKGKNLARKAAISTIKRTVQDAIPYRNWIRKLSGAEKHDRKVAESIEAGKARRSFLKGYAVGAGCDLYTELTVESSVIEHQE